MLHNHNASFQNISNLKKIVQQCSEINSIYFYNTKVQTEWTENSHSYKTTKIWAQGTTELSSPRQNRTLQQSSSSPSTRPLSSGVWRTSCTGNNIKSINWKCFMQWKQTDVVIYNSNPLVTLVDYYFLVLSIVTRRSQL